MSVNVFKEVKRGFLQNSIEILKVNQITYFQLGPDRSQPDSSILLDRGRKGIQPWENKGTTLFYTLCTYMVAPHTTHDTCATAAYIIR